MKVFTTCLLSCFVWSTLADLLDVPDPYLVLPLLPTLKNFWTSGLFYSCKEQDLLFVDRNVNQICRVTLDEDEIPKVSTLDLNVGSSIVIPVQGQRNRFLITQKNELVYVVWPHDLDDKADSNFHVTNLVATVDYYDPILILSEGKVDFYGNLVIGTFPFTGYKEDDYPLCLGSLYYFNLGRAGKAGVTQALSQVTYISDVEWTSDYRIMYLSESYTACIYSFQYDLITGLICNRRAVFCFADFGILGAPAGITIDVDGNLYVAGNGAGLVLKINPNTGALLLKIIIPAKAVTDVVFGFKSLDVLLVSTKSLGDPLEPLAGLIFVVKNLGVEGRCSNEAVLNADVTPAYIHASSRNA